MIRCAHMDCTRFALRRGLCDRHYQQVLRAGERAIMHSLLSPSLYPVDKR